MRNLYGIIVYLIINLLLIQLIKYFEQDFFLDSPSISSIKCLICVPFTNHWSRILWILIVVYVHQLATSIPDLWTYDKKRRKDSINFIRFCRWCNLYMRIIMRIICTFVCIYSLKCFLFVLYLKHCTYRIIRSVRTE